MFLLASFVSSPRSAFFFVFETRPWALTSMFGPGLLVPSRVPQGRPAYRVPTSTLFLMRASRCSSTSQGLFPFPVLVSLFFLCLSFP